MTALTIIITSNSIKIQKIAHLPVFIPDLIQIKFKSQFQPTTPPINKLLLFFKIYLSFIKTNPFSSLSFLINQYCQSLSSINLINKYPLPQ